MKRLIRIFGLPLFFVLLNGAGAAQTKGYFPEVEPYNSVQDVSIVQVISNPPEFDGKRVRFIGFARIEFEGDAIYLHREDYEYGIARDAIWLNVPADMTKEQKDAVNMHYVICTGVFNAKAHGHMGAFAGEIQNVRRLQLWADRPQSGKVSPPTAPRKK